MCWSQSAWMILRRTQRAVTCLSAASVAKREREYVFEAWLVFGTENDTLPKAQTLNSLCTDPSDTWSRTCKIRSESRETNNPPVLQK